MTNISDIFSAGSPQYRKRCLLERTSTLFFKHTLFLDFPARFSGVIFCAEMEQFDFKRPVIHFLNMSL